jgi:hypothetical protein
MDKLAHLQAFDWLLGELGSRKILEMVAITNRKSSSIAKACGLL